MRRVNITNFGKNSRKRGFVSTVCDEFCSSSVGCIISCWCLANEKTLTDSEYNVL